MELTLSTFAPAIAAIGRAGVPFLEQGLTAVLSGVAGPFGMLVSPALNSLWPAINAKFGLAPDAAPDQTAVAITADPDATAKLQAVADEHHDEITRAMAKDALDEKGTENARATELQRAAHGSRAERLAPLVLAGIIVLGFFGTVLLVLLLRLNTSDPIIVYALTTEGAAFLALVGYYFGSSIGSKAKTDLMAAGLPPARHGR